MGRVLCAERAFAIALYGGDRAGVRAFHGGKLGVRQAHFVPRRTAEHRERNSQNLRGKRYGAFAEPCDNVLRRGKTPFFRNDCQNRRNRHCFRVEFFDSQTRDLPNLKIL